jgi:hypothetical protein
MLPFVRGRALQFHMMCWVLLIVGALFIPGTASAQGNPELKVHLAQANNDSPYAFVRAKFKPGEVTDPWAVRFFDDQGKEIPYFVWDSMTWHVAQEGKAEWGKRYALLNHAPGDTPEVTGARSQKLEWATKNLPELGAKLQAQEQAAKKAGDSVCAALYLLRHPVPAFGKERLTLRIYPKRQVEPKQQQWKGPNGEKRLTVDQGALSFQGLPDKLSVAWKGKEIFHSAGFQAGDSADTVSHADPARPFVVETTTGIITKLVITGQTKGRKDSAMDWQCTYWLFPEGGFVALEGFNLGDPAGYVGGPQKLSIWQADGNFTTKQVPLWKTPWWLHQAGDGGFVATHLFYATPLTIGFGNNPFTVNAEGDNKDPKVVAAGNKLSLTWSHRLDDPAIVRLIAPKSLPYPLDPKTKAVKPVPWQPKVDWLYRQYVVGLGEKAPAAEGALRDVLGAAAGWIDRPISEEEAATLLVQMMPRIATSRESSEIGLLKIVPAVLANNPAAINKALAGIKDQSTRTDFYINLIKTHVKLGGKPFEGKKKNDPDGTAREGWTGNACYHAGLMPCFVRVLEHFDLPFPQDKYRNAIVRFADFSLELVGGDPIDFDKANALFKTEWPSRVVPMIPLVLHAHTLKPDAKYAKAAKILFQDLMQLVAQNPHGYWPAWNFQPKADKFDTVYNPVSYERGITAFWSDAMLDVIGRDEAAHFVAAQARWFVFSGQLLDSQETDNATAIRASTHGGHTNLRNQIGLYLYDDFDFYRGLLGDLLAWSAAACQVPGPKDESGTGPYRSLELSNGGSSMLRWALGIKPGSKWLESKVQTFPQKGFRLQAWSRLPLEKPTLKVGAKDVGLKVDGDVLQAQLAGPAFRQPAEFEVTWTANAVALKVSKPAKIRLAYHVLHPEWPAKDKLVLERRGPEGLVAVAPGEIVWKDDWVEWQATPGEYELRPAKK